MVASVLLPNLSPTTCKNLNFCDFSEIYKNWNLLSVRDPLFHLSLKKSLDSSNLPLLDRGFSKRHLSGKLSDISFNLLHPHTWNTCLCCETHSSSSSSNRYFAPNQKCGKYRYCPRCNNLLQQQFMAKHLTYFSTSYSFYHLILTDPTPYSFKFSNFSTLLSSFYSKIDSSKKLLKDGINHRNRMNFLKGLIWSQEASCSNLSTQTYSHHLHCLIACQNRSCIDLDPLLSLGVIPVLKPIHSVGHYLNCLKYFQKPITFSIKERYQVEYSPSNSELLYSNVVNGIDVLQELFAKRKFDSCGIFRKSNS